MKGQWQNPRGIAERIIVTGSLVLETPTHLGDGDAESYTDIPLLLDPLEGKAFLTGASIAGALRSYLRELEQGHREAEQHSSMATLLFGEATDEESVQSFLIVDDAIGQNPQVELRDGVAIKPETRTAEPKKKFDIELLVAGTSFDLQFELLVQKEHKEELLRAFAITLRGMERGEIGIGMRKRRGFGRCRVKEWTVQRYDVKTPKGMIDWLSESMTGAQSGTGIADLLQVSLTDIDKRRQCVLDAIFLLERSSLLIRSGFGDACAPDAVHLHSKRNDTDTPVPVLSGTSIAGALRARALRILKTLDLKNVEEIVNDLFGKRVADTKEKLTSSRLWVEESIIQNPIEMVQSRVKLDRFTGGAFPGALFSEQPVFGKGDTQLHVRVSVENPDDKDVGLLLLLLKDLWTGDLPLGGESGVGRGRLCGAKARLQYSDCTWEIAQDKKRIHVTGGDIQQLEHYVQGLSGGKN